MEIQQEVVVLLVIFVMVLEQAVEHQRIVLTRLLAVLLVLVDRVG